MRFSAIFFLFVVAVLQFLASAPIEVPVTETDITVAESDAILTSDFEDLDAQSTRKTTGSILAYIENPLI